MFGSNPILFGLDRFTMSHGFPLVLISRCLISLGRNKYISLRGCGLMDGSNLAYFWVEHGLLVSIAFEYETSKSR